MVQVFFVFPLKIWVYVRGSTFSGSEHASTEKRRAIVMYFVSFMSIRYQVESERWRIVEVNQSNSHTDRPGRGVDHAETIDGIAVGWQRRILLRRNRDGIVSVVDKRKRPDLCECKDVNVPVRQDVMFAV